VPLEPGLGVRGELEASQDGYDEPVYIWQPVGTPPKYNILPLFVGALKVTLLAMMMSVPLGIGAALFVALYAPRKVREVVKPMVELLAGIPSVVLGFFALMLVATWAQDLFGFRFRLNAVVAAIALSLTIVPVIFTIAEDALQAVPRSLSEAGARARRSQVSGGAARGGSGRHPRHRSRRGAGLRARHRRDHDRADGLGQRRHHGAVQLRHQRAHGHGQHRRRAGRDRGGRPALAVLFMLGVLLFAVTFVLNVIGDLAIRRLQKRLTAA
jgi:phosphate transport system permease protein